MPFYPGACERYREVVAAHPEAERFGAAGDDAVPWTLIPGVDADLEGEPVLQVDPFVAARAEVPLDADSPAAFCDRATAFCNEQVWGTLGMSLLVHPSSRKDPAVAAAVDRMVAALRYGTVAVNIWCAKGYAIVCSPWGAFPGHTPADIQSGCGLVHNTYLFDDPEKTVVRAPFTAVPDPPWFVTFRHRRDVLEKNTWLEGAPRPGSSPACSGRPCGAEMRCSRAAAAVATVALLAGCGGGSRESGPADTLASRPVASSLVVTSTAFAEQGAIPPRYTCEGADVAPPLAWEGVPAGTAELALVVDDPDAPGGTYVHWVLTGIDPTVSGLAEGQVPAGAVAAENSAGEAAYTGPCPPKGDGPHRYRFVVYALGEPVGPAVAGDGLDAVGAIATAKGVLTGTFER